MMALLLCCFPLNTTLCPLVIECLLQKIVCSEPPRLQHQGGAYTLSCGSRCTVTAFQALMVS